MDETCNSSSFQEAKKEDFGKNSEINPWQTEGAKPTWPWQTRPCGGLSTELQMWTMPQMCPFGCNDISHSGEDWQWPIQEEISKELNCSWDLHFLYLTRHCLAFKSRWESLPDWIFWASLWRGESMTVLCLLAFDYSGDNIYWGSQEATKHYARKIEVNIV